jgi:hypothetical protein
MDIRIKQLSYGTLISHTFPGFLLGLQLLFTFYLIFPDYLKDILPTIDQKSYVIFYYTILATSCLIFTFIISSLLGSILDAVHNWLYDRYMKNSIKLEKQIIKKIPKDELEIYNSFLTEDS